MKSHEFITEVGPSTAFPSLTTQDMESDPDFSSNFMSGGIPRKLKYSTGRSKTGYRSGLEGIYSVDKIEPEGEGFRVFLKSKKHGPMDDIYDKHSRENRTGNGFKLGSWPVDAGTAMKYLRWARKFGIK